MQEPRLENGRGVKKVYGTAQTQVFQHYDNSSDVNKAEMIKYFLRNRIEEDQETIRLNVIGPSLSTMIFQGMEMYIPLPELSNLFIIPSSLI